jgi:hypothetical protein
MAATIRQELEEEFLSTIRKGQETAREAVAGGYEFAGHLLANQRQFAGEVITATSPLRPGRAGPRAEGRSRQGRRLGSESATPAGRAATRQRRNPQFPALPRSVVRDEGDGP